MLKRAQFVLVKCYGVSSEVFPLSVNMTFVVVCNYDKFNPVIFVCASRTLVVHSMCAEL